MKGLKMRRKPAKTLKTKIRIGFLLGKNTCTDRLAFGQHPRDLPVQFLRKTPQKSYWHEHDDSSAIDAKYQVDACLAWKVHKSFPEFVVDPIPLEEVSIKRLRGNHINFMIGADYITARLHDEKKADKSPLAKRFLKAMKDQKSNLFMEWPLQNWVYIKKNYMTQLMKANVPMLPTIFVGIMPDHNKLLRDIKAKGWKRFVVKPEMSSWSIGFMAAYTANVEKDPTILKLHFKKWQHRYPGYLVQEFVEDSECPGDPFPEIRIYWVNGEYCSALQLTATSVDVGEVFGYSIPPKEDLDRALAIGRVAVQEASKVCTFKGKPTEPGLFRTDIAVTKCKVRGLRQIRGKTMFLNEVESMACDWHNRVFLNDPNGLNGKSFEHFQGFSMLDRMAEFCVKKARELCGDGTAVQLEWAAPVEPARGTKRPR